MSHNFREIDISLENGVITRIHLENFMIYDEKTLEPERYLNVVIEHNGYVNSIIVAAIILGLGGKPNIIGQALHVGEYVKFGRDSAKIEIHLKNSIGQDSIITRTFTKEGKTTWMINDNQADDNNVQVYTSIFNIQCAVNKRWDLLLNMVERPRSCQYFLPIPEFESELTITETVTKFCIFNGSIMTIRANLDADAGAFTSER